LLRRNDVSVKKISEMMGHKNEKVTISVCIHPFNPDTVDTQDVMDGIWGSAA